MSEQDLVKRCLEGICQKNGFAVTDPMTQRDFEHISQEIENSTGTLISVSTIKRLLHGRFSRMPQTATLNAISTYLGFKNWQDYKNAVVNTGNTPNPNANKSENVSPDKNIRSKFSLNWKWIGAAAIAAGIIVFLSFVNLSSKPALNYDKAQLGAKKTTANAIPNTVVFNYNIDEVNADSFFIQQSWDRRRRVRIYKNSYTLTDIYYEPGYHTAKLIANDSIIRTIDVSIPTDRWFLFSKDQDPNSIPQYIKENTAFNSGWFGLDKTDLDNNQIKTEGEKIFVYEYFPGKMEVNSDDFTFKARVRMKEVRNNQCPYIMYEVFCQRRFMFFKSMPGGCASETDAQFGDNFLSGKKIDLSSLCSATDQWTDVEVTVKNKLATIFINNKQVYSIPYHHSSGLITGLGFISNGLCEVDYVGLKGLDGNVVYQNDFNDSLLQHSRP
jgi:hypothetical protein